MGLGSAGKRLYFVAVKGGRQRLRTAPDIELTAGQYLVWLRLMDTEERPIRVAPEDVRVL